MIECQKCGGPVEEPDGRFFVTGLVTRRDGTVISNDQRRQYFCCAEHMEEYGCQHAIPAMVSLARMSRSGEFHPARERLRRRLEHEAFCRLLA